MKSKATSEDISGRGESKSVDVSRSNLKVELKSVTFSNETKNLIMDTLRYLHGEVRCLLCLSTPYWNFFGLTFNIQLQNFSFDNTEVKQSKRRLGNQYWVNQGHLRVQNCYNYSNKTSVNDDKVSSLLLENLERYVWLVCMPRDQRS